MGVQEQDTHLAQGKYAGQGTSPDMEPAVTSGSATGLERWLARRLLAAVGDPPVGIELWDGSRVAQGQSRFTLQLHDRGALWLLVSDAGYQFGELFSQGRLEVDGDLVDFLDTVYRGMEESRWQRWANQFLQRLRHRPRLNTLAGSKENIHQHYNLGNAFYELWLDTEAMQYTCAYFPDPTMSIEQAQVAKMHHVARKLQLKEGDTVVEAGCGWGGLARFFAQHYGVTVRAYNISSEQIAYARKKAEDMGLSDRVEYIEDDYRNAQGEYDVFVSVGMLEHVGTKHYETLGAVIDRCLKDDGRGLVHSIGRNKPGLMNAWIEKRIFPGAYPPSLKEMMDIFEPHNFSVQDVENLRLHYAKTLEHWLARYEANADAVREMFDEDFVRAWRLYLAGSIAAFTSSELQLFQVAFTRAGNNQLPSSRAHLYQ
jgi:cyclopropane-fatty-acyl-phospholipid synthase